MDVNIKKICEMQRLQEEWKTIEHEAPDEGCIMVAKNMAILLNQHAIRIDWLQAEYHGAIKFVMIGSDDKWCEIVCDNDGDIGVCLSDGSVWVVMDDYYTIGDSMKRIKKWLS